MPFLKRSHIGEINSGAITAVKGLPRVFHVLLVLLGDVLNKPKRGFIGIVNSVFLKFGIGVQENAQDRQEGDDDQEDELSAEGPSKQSVHILPFPPLGIMPTIAIIWPARRS
jgi:hypothetical protein